MWLDFVRLGSCIQGRVLVDNLKLKKIGTLKTEIITIKNVPKGYNISYSNEYKTKRDSKIAIIGMGYIDGFNLKRARDVFSLKDNILSCLIQFKKIFLKDSLKVKIKGKTYSVIGKLGTNHAVIDITGDENIKIGDEVEILDYYPIYVNSNIERKYV